MASIYGLISEMTTALGSNTFAQTGNLDKQQALADENIALAKGASSSALGVSAQRIHGELAAQEAGRTVAAGLGNDPNDPNSLLSILVQDFRENTLAARAQQQVVAEKQSVSLYDDAPQFILNQLTLPGDIRAYEATAGKAQAAKEGIAQMQALTTASAQAAKATAQTMTKESIKQQAIVDAAALNSKINALQIDALGYDSEAIKIINTNNATTLQWAMQAHSMQLQDAADLRAGEEHKWRLSQKDDAEKELDRYAQVVSAGAAVYGLPGMGIEEIKARTKYGTAAEKSRLEKLYLKGMDVAVTGSKAIGATPGEAIINALDVGGAKDEQSKPARDYLERVTRQVVGSMNLTAADYKNPETKTRISEEVNNYLFGKTDPKTGKRNERMGELYKMAADMDRPGSIYKAPELNTLMGLPSIKSNPLYESVFSPAVSAGVTKSDPASLYALGAEAVKRGVINEKQLAIGLSDFYKTVTATTYASSGASKFALPYRPSYVSRIPDSFGMGDVQQDWSKPENWIMYHTMSKSAQQLGRGSAMSGMWR